MGRTSVRARIKKMWTSLNRAARRAQARLRRRTAAADVWLQDHHVPVVIGMFILLGISAGLLLWMDWDTVTAYAKVIAPVLTIISIVTGAIRGVIKRFRRRRAARLARDRAASATVARPRAAENPPCDGEVSAGDVTGEESR